MSDAAAEALLSRRDELARAITDALYAELPELLTKYGAAGRAKCLQDMRYTLEHLAPAVALGEPVLFERYVEWVRDMLHARGVPAGELRRCLELARATIEHRLSAAESAAVLAPIAAGIGVLKG